MVLVPIADIHFNKLIYPRALVEGTDTPYWGFAAKLARDMRAGSVMPPIVLAKLDGRNVIIDGYNRTLAYKQNNRTEIEAEFIEVANAAEAYEQSIIRNIKHGNNLSEIEIARAAVKLQEEFGRSEAEASMILNIQPVELKKILTERVVKKPDGSSWVRKTIFKGQELPASMTEDDQRIFTVRSQLNLCRQFKTLIQSEALMLDSRQVLEELNEIADTLNRYRRR